VALLPTINFAAGAFLLKSTERTPIKGRVFLVLYDQHDADQLALVTHGRSRRDLALRRGGRWPGRRVREWLGDRGLEVPDATSTRHKMKMGGTVHEMLMPGMLTDEEMAALDKARGPEFDRLFLEGMIKHHQGAIDMVDVLFKSYGAAQDETIFKFASDVYADQGIEIERMREMLGDRKQ
jgi:hypothetical protein